MKESWANKLGINGGFETAVLHFDYEILPKPDEIACENIRRHSHSLWE